MKMSQLIPPSIVFVGLLLVLTSFILWTSLDFQECIRTYGSDNQSGEHLKGGRSISVSTILAWRHCAGAYVVDKNAVITALGTIVIAIFTAILGIFTVRLAQSTRVAADAAKESSDAAVAVERARFFIVLEDCNLSHLVTAFRDFGRLTPGDSINIKFCFKNYGKTPGILKLRIIGSLFAAELPDTLPLPLSVKDFPETMIGGDAQTMSSCFSPTIAPTADEIGSVMTNNLPFWFYGRLYYDDVFGRSQVHCFYFRSRSNSTGDSCVLEPVEPTGQKKST